MISQLTGTVVHSGATWIVLQISGLGLKALCSPNTVAIAEIGQEITLYTSLIVREDSLTLYGFADISERDAFELVQTASGVGPKLAQAIVSVLSLKDLRQAIMSENLAQLTSVPGIGRKGAQKLIIELKDKVAGLDIGEKDVATMRSYGWQDQVSQGLQSLGWSAKDAETACENVAPIMEKNPDTPIGILMRAALASLARH